MSSTQTETEKKAESVAQSEKSQPKYVAENEKIIGEWLVVWQKDHEFKLSDSQKKQHLGYMRRISEAMGKNFKEVKLSEVNKFLIGVSTSKTLGEAPKYGLSACAVRMFTYLGILGDKWENPVKKQTQSK